MVGSPKKRERRMRLAAMTTTNADRTMEELVLRISTGENFDAICRALDVPRTKLLVWLQADEGRWALYLKAHEARSHHLVSETIGIADGEGDAADKKVKIDTRFRYAKHHAPGLYREDGGDGGKMAPVLNITVQVEGAKPVGVVIDQGD